MSKEQSDKRDALTEWLRENAPDCGDNSCLFGGRGKGGMRTNGGCRCFKDVRPDMKRIFIDRLWAAFTLSHALRFTTDPLEGDLPMEHPNRCKLRDGLLYAHDQTPAWRCRKRESHDGPCSSHNDCGVMGAGRTVCGMLPGHEGPHAWATEVRVPAASAPSTTPQKPVAFVPLHPRTGPLWANTVPSLDADRPAHYATMPLFASPVSATLQSEQLRSTAALALGNLATIRRFLPQTPEGDDLDAGAIVILRVLEECLRRPDGGKATS